MGQLRRVGGPEGAPGGSGAVGAIGIWHATGAPGRGALVRRSTPNERQANWASARVIPAKSHKERFVLIGESVARGYLLDPMYTPAGALESTLLAGGRGVEVIDLARTDLSLFGLVDLTTRAVRLLEPEVVIIFAGNNWHLANVAEDEFCALTSGMLAGRLTTDEYRARVVDRMTARVGDAFGWMVQRAREARVRLMFVLPECDFVRWWPTAAEPWLVSSASAERWHEIRRALRSQLCGGISQGVSELVDEMMTLEQSGGAIGKFARGRLAHWSGDSATAKRLLMDAHDEMAFQAGPTSPWCFSFIKSAIRQLAASHAVELVDVPELFSDLSADGLPDKRLFFDYCHLTCDGIDVVVSEVATRCLSSRAVSNGTSAPEADVVRCRTVESATLAALHCANWDQPERVCMDWVRQAIGEDDSWAVRRVGQFVLAHAGFVPSSVSAAFLNWTPDGAPSSVAKLLGDSTRTGGGRVVNWRFVETVLRLVDGEQRETLLRSLTEAHAIDVGGKDLLSGEYCRDGDLQLPVETRRSYRQARRGRSTFRFFLTSPSALVLTACWRCRHAADGGVVVIRVNEGEVARIEVGTVWEKTQVLVNSVEMRSGLNHLTLEWPARAWRDGPWLETLAAVYRSGELASPTPAWADIQSLKIAPAR